MKSLLRTLTLGLGLFALGAGCEETPPAKVPVAGTVEPSAGAVTPPPAKSAVGSLAQRDPASRVVAFRVVFQAGSADDPAGKEGATALAASMIAESGTEKLTFGELAKQLYPFASSISVNVDRDQTVFSAEVAAESLSAFYPLLRDVLLAPRFDKESFERLRARAQSRLGDELKGGNDEALGKEALQAVLYAGHPYGHPAVGTERGLAGLSLEDVAAQKKRVFCADRVTAGIAGGFPEGFDKQMAQDLGALPACEGARALPAPKKTTGLKVTIVDKPSADSMAFSMGFLTDMTRADADFPAAAFFTAVMGLHRQSAGVLYNRLREARGFNYGDYMYPEYFEQEGWGRFPLPNIVRRDQFVSIWLRPVKPENGLFALRGALYYYRQKLLQGVPDEELTRFRSFLSGYIGLEQQTPSRRLGFALDDAAYGESTPHLARLRAGWAALNSAKLKEVVARRFTGTDLTIVIVTKDAAAVKAALVKGDKTPPTYDAPKPKEVTDEDRLIEALPLGLKDEDVTIWPIADVFK